MQSPVKKMSLTIEPESPGSEPTTKGVSLFRQVLNKTEDVLNGLDWQKKVDAKIPSLLNQYRLRIDDDLNADFQDTFDKIMASLNHDVYQVITAKMGELEASLKALKSNEHSRLGLTLGQYLRIVNTLELIPGKKFTLPHGSLL